MDTRLDDLDQMLELAATLLRRVAPEDTERPTPCPELGLGALAGHLAVWVQVFEAAVNARPVPFDPFTHGIATGWAEIIDDARPSIISGWRSLGTDRMVDFAGMALPAEVVLNMMLAEYVGHAWDIATSLGGPLAIDDHLVEVAFDAARSIISEDHRGPQLFDREVAVGDDAPTIDRFVGFLGRDPRWVAPG